MWFFQLDLSFLSLLGGVRLGGALGPGGACGIASGFSGRPGADIGAWRWILGGSFKVYLQMGDWLWLATEDMYASRDVFLWE